MRTMIMAALTGLALAACGGTQESVREPEHAGGDVRAERGERDPASDETPGLDAASPTIADCWNSTEEGEGTPGLDADVQWDDC